MNENVEFFCCNETATTEIDTLPLHDARPICRIWDTYPVKGTTSGDFSGTIIGDSYLIKDGRFAAPLKPNTVRMNDNVLRLINNTLGIAAQRRATVRWSSDQVTWAPEIAVSGFGLEEISEYMESV